MREIRILQLLKHENVVNLIEICRTKPSSANRYRSTFYLVFDFCEHDLAGLLSNINVKFSLGEIKKVMQQLLNGLYYIHSNKVCDSIQCVYVIAKYFTFAFDFVDFASRYEGGKRFNYEKWNSKIGRFRAGTCVQCQQKWSTKSVCPNCTLIDAKSCVAHF